MCRKLFASWRLLKLIMWLCLGTILALLWVKVDLHKGYTTMQSGIIRWWMRGLLRVIGVSLVHNKASTASVWVANHVSWCDIVALMAIKPSRFLSKSEVAHWPVIGWLAKRAGTLFIKRGAHQAQKVTNQLAQVLRLGDSIVFFPEGTSQGGEPKKFHARLFALPIAERAIIAPIALIYQGKNHSLREDLSYTGNQSFIQNLWYLLQQKDVTIQVIFMPDIASEGLTRNDLADACQESVTCGWQQIVMVK